MAKWSPMWVWASERCFAVNGSQYALISSLNGNVEEWKSIVILEFARKSQCRWRWLTYVEQMHALWSWQENYRRAINLLPVKYRYFNDIKQSFFLKSNKDICQVDCPCEFRQPVIETELYTFGGDMHYSQENISQWSVLYIWNFLEQVMPSHGSWNKVRQSLF